MIGVNVSGNDAEKLEKVMDKERLIWRSFADPGEFGKGTIASKWNLAGTPTLYVIDHQGVIRHKWVGSPGEKAIDEALEKLIIKAQSNGENTRQIR